ncbi:hypothetical protein ACYCI3_28695 [Escherichia coli]|uniref:hypothetical protein n=1 Tax=Enterobacteriaceae TaxID=543 RepID=UPI00228AE2C9|nr:hypothetical protein [Salmonella enterica subsp. enterica serovar Muenchen]MEC5669508.1 hypothetical protein [Escherichia coli]HCU2346394.1 hypothetical protein [Citrobacter freundii]MEC5710778.1 hypothetical protein [Escherichia coli]HCX4269413.1 hypothetical protein [Escherichia coli]
MIGFPHGFDVNFLERLAASLSDGWILNKVLSAGRSTVYFSNQKNRDYMISIFASKGKYSISTLLVHSVWGKPEDFCSMHASMKRNPEHVANEIKRRLLPGYDAAICESKINLKKYQCEREKGDLIVSALKRLFKMHQNGLNSSHLFYSRGNDKPDLDVTRYVSSGDRFDLKIKHIDGELLVKIAALIKEHEGA